MQYYLRIIFSRALARDPGDRFATAGEFGLALEALAAEFDRPVGWAALRERLKRLFVRAPAEGEAGGASRPLAAVLRARLTLSLDTASAEESEPEKSPDSGGGAEPDIYRFRDETAQ